MLDLYYWPTPNGCKITILLHELDVPYNLIPVNIAKGDQFKPEFARVSPNRRMPAIVDHDPADRGETIAIFESGAIMMYLAEKHGRFLPTDTRARYDVVKWLMWQMGGLGPMCGQAHHFRQYANEQIPYAIERYTDEVNRLYGVLDTQLAGRRFIAGDYSIADIAWGKTLRIFLTSNAGFWRSTSGPARERAGASDANGLAAAPSSPKSPRPYCSARKQSKGSARIPN